MVLPLLCALRAPLSITSIIDCHRAGTTDSPLTSHGILQIERLAQYFASTSQTRFSHVFSSDLQRAVVTAEGIVEHQAMQEEDFDDDESSPPERSRTLTVTETALLREQHFGSREGTGYLRPRGRHEEGDEGHEQQKTDSVPAETEQAMRARADAFLNDYFLPVVFDSRSDQAVAIVAHGIILRVLWDCLARLFSPVNIRVGYDAEVVASRGGGGGGGSLLTPFWSNTGFMQVSIEPDSSTATVPCNNTLLLSGWTMTVQSVDSKPHLADLRRTRGGIGSMQHDTSQRRIDSFFRPQP